MNRDLIRRLDGSLDPLCKEAADEIQHLSMEIKSFIAERERWLAQFQRQENQIERDAATISALLPTNVCKHEYGKWYSSNTDGWSWSVCNRCGFKMDAKFQEKA